MRFARALIGLPAAGTVDEAVAFASRLVRRGARVALRPDPTPVPDEATSPFRVAERLAALDARTRAVRAALVADGFDVVDELDAASPAEVVVLPSTAPSDLVVALLAADRPVALLAVPMPPVRAVGLVAWNEPRRVRRAAELLVDHPPDAAVHLVSLRGAFPTDGAALRDLLGLPGTPEVHALHAGYTDAFAALEAFVGQTPLDVIVTMAPPRLALRPLVERLRALAPGVLLVPGDDPLVEFRERLELFDAVVAGDVLVLDAVTVDAAGLAAVAEDRDLVAVARGRGLGPAALRRGQVVLPVAPDGVVGLATDPDQPAGTLEATARVLRPDGAPIVLVPIDQPAPDVDALRADGRRVWAVATDACSPAAVAASTGADAVVHAGAVLRDGGPRDVPTAAAAVQRARSARALRELGYPVVAAVDAGPVPGVVGLARGPLPERAALAGLLAAGTLPAPGGDDLGARLARRADARPTAVTRLVWQPENHAARTRLLAAIGGARRRVHLQSYIFLDDPVGREVVDALRAAADRGVEVRVIVDSLWSRHGSLRMENPLLDRLADVPGLELRAFRPVSGVVDLKQRNHRKLLLVDGEVAILAGRNVSTPYYTGFDEVTVTPTTPQEDVPWLDLSVELGGPVVAELERLFAASWRDSGGASYAPDPPHPAVATGAPSAWVVAHRGLEDAATLETWRVLFEAARTRITVVNTFPMQHEVQQALLARLRAGVAVRVLTGHVRPRFQGGAQPFPGSPERDLMTELVHGRLDPLAEAGAEVYAVGVPPAPGWDPALGTVLPHVHTKWIAIDGEVGAVGSANVDLSSAYWEHEAVLVLRDRARVGELERVFDALVATSVRFDPADPTWRRRAMQRAWVCENWPGLLS